MQSASCLLSEARLLLWGNPESKSFQERSGGFQLPAGAWALSKVLNLTFLQHSLLPEPRLWFLERGANYSPSTSTLLRNGMEGFC